MQNQLIGRLRRSIERRRINAQCPDLDLTPEEASERVFCFGGEFGYELVSWLPYLYFLKQHTGLTLKTCSRPGSSCLYPFSDEHLEYGPGITSEDWGDYQTYDEIQQKMGLSELVFPRKRRQVKVGGYEWLVKDIHTVIPEDTYGRLDYSHIDDPMPFSVSRPYVVINNKFYRQWGLPAPVNCFFRQDLIDLRDFLLERGYAVVYNHFREVNRTIEQLELDDNGIFGDVEHTIDLNDHFGQADAGARNRAQIALYNKAQFVLAPQGGSAYLPAIAGRDVYMIMRRGLYLDYTEMARLYGGKFEAFYETSHMLLFLQQHLP